MARLSIPRQVQLYLDSQGIKSTVKQGRHVKVLFEVGETKLIYTCGKSVSDWRVVANVRSDLRRMLRDAGASPT